MGVNNRNIGSILLGAAAVYAAYKYNKLTDAEKQQLAGKLKSKINTLKTEAESSLGNAKTYFNDFKNKASDILKEHFPEAEKKFNDMFSSTKKDAAATGSSQQTGF
jgi:hypothetical protein